ncbi:hypothetical protein Leryth_011075 [Lithospermum erythrorhizon]|uniref:Uncharacterized protein n=1 Tax=Lithospermum erythrorhizon TaxID=34254 RepID=A0AAV3P4C2_LITER|nr:hypothetical protein Leryth_011075 [Lithospermum erythrorhizon]
MKIILKMSYTMVIIPPPPPFTTALAAAERRMGRGSSNSSSLGFGGKKKESAWKCVDNCGACCKLLKGPTFPSPEDIFDDPFDIQLYNSLIGADGWCIHFDKATRKCSIYSDRPYFCRVEPDVFFTLYGIERKKFNKEACSSCVDTIKAVHGSSSQELDNFNNAIWKDCT